MSTRTFSWSGLLAGAAGGGITALIILLSCSYATGLLLGGDEAAGTVGSIMVFLGAPVALVVGAVLGARVFAFHDRRLLATIGGAVLGLVITYIIAIPVSIVYGGAIDRTGVLYLLGYGLPVAVVVGGIWGRRRFERSQQSTPST